MVLSTWELRVLIDRLRELQDDIEKVNDIWCSEGGGHYVTDSMVIDDAIAEFAAQLRERQASAPAAAAQ
jgi:hypothetical protein